MNGTKSINLARKRNIDRFPDDFCFKLTEEEYRNLRFQIENLKFDQEKYRNLKFQFETSSSDNYGGVRKLPYAFTEQGVAMLSSVLKTEIASKVSINIMRTFVFMRRYISENLIEQKLIQEMVLRYDKDIKLIQETFDKLCEKEIKNHIYFNGQIYDSYSKIIDIMNEAKDELIIIDGMLVN